MKLSVLNPKQSLNKAYLKEKVGRENIELFKENLSRLLGKINEKEHEEHLKNLVSEFLKDTWYKDTHEINTKERQDLVIHTGKSSKESVGVILEVKKPSNKAEMISQSKPNSKAMHELILYYLRERIEHKNIDVKYLIVTNIYEWFIFDELWFDKNVHRNTKLVKDFENWKLAGKDTGFFYQSIAKPFLDSIEETIPCTFFDIRPFEKIISNNDKTDDIKLIALFKVLSPVHLLKKPFANDSNTLDTKFYSELLHIIGLEEVKEGSKKLIRRKRNPDTASILENTIMKLEDKDCLRNVSNLSSFGSDKDEQLFNVALELTITWINRVLFLKLLEAQLSKYHKGKENYLFLNIKTVHDFDELSNLFFQVLAEKQATRRSHLKDKYKHVPYLNSSLFERTELERQTFDIGGLDNNLSLDFISTTVLKNDNGKKMSGSATTLEYLLNFLDAYDFTSEGSEEIQEQNKNLINASVLGLIFEKINGYKDGSFFTPGFVTMYMCRESIRRAVIQKFNDKYDIDCETIPELNNYVAARFKPKDILEFNKVINELKICDPAVGSGHFLVSALNELLSIKAELGILADKDGERLRGYEINIENDELIVTFNDNTEIFEYSVTGNSTNKEIQRVQKTLFHEKETIIENCLFGVDINPNSVKICRLRLWIELLKNAYYTEDSRFLELETLPNIDINIKCGNSLISRFPLNADLKKALKGKWTIDGYRVAVHAYHNAENKDQKRKFEEIINSIKSEFRTEIRTSDPRRKRLEKLRSEQYLLVEAPKLEFEIEIKKGGKSIEKAKIKKLSQDIGDLENELKEIDESRIFNTAFEWRFEFPEVLNDNREYEGFDLVIGNPPYVNSKGEKIDKLFKDYALENYNTSKYQIDTYILFIERAIQLVKDKGTLSYIVPNAWLNNLFLSDVRKYVLEHMHIQEICNMPSSVFDGAVVDTVVIRGSRGKLSGEVLVSGCSDNSFRHLTTLNQASFMTNENYAINIFSDSKIDSILRKVEKNSFKLDSCTSIARGVGVYHKRVGHTKELIAADPYQAKSKKDKTFVPYLRGKNIKPYHTEWNSDSYISYGKWLAEPREAKYFEGPRIVLRQIPSQKLIVTFIDDKFIIDQSVFIARFEKTDQNPKSILGILGSKLMSFYFRNKYSEFDDLFPKVKLQHFKDFPITSSLSKYSEELNKLVEQILEKKTSNGNWNSTKLEEQIDGIVYKAYGLTAEEIEFIEAEFDAK